MHGVYATINTRFVGQPKQHFSNENSSWVTDYVQGMHMDRLVCITSYIHIYTCAMGYQLILCNVAMYVCMYIRKYISYAHSTIKAYWVRVYNTIKNKQLMILKMHVVSFT